MSESPEFASSVAGAPARTAFDTPSFEPSPPLDTPRPSFTIVRGYSPLVAAAIHDGHELRPDVAQLLSLPDPSRRRYESPHTGLWTKVSDSRIVARRSRLEVDLDRPRRDAVPSRLGAPGREAATNPWKFDPPEGVVERSLAQYDAFYDAVEDMLADKARRNGHFVVYDLRSHNHREAGPEAAPADPATHPDVSVGTSTLDRARWGEIVDRVIADLRTVDFLGRKLDVRENARPSNGEFPARIHRRFPASGCVIVLDFKKFFMDEWSGEVQEDVLRAIEHTLQFVAAGTLGVLARMAARPVSRPVPRPRPRPARPSRPTGPRLVGPQQPTGSA